MAEPSANPSRSVAATGSSALTAFLDALERPLAFLRQAPAPVAARASFPAAEFGRRALELRERITDSLTRKRLEDLQGSLARWAAANPEERATLTEDCWQRLGGLRETRGAPVRYRRRDDSVDDDLQSLEQSLQFVPSVGPRRADLLRKFGLATIEDLLYHLPFRYEDRRILTPIRDLKVGEVASVAGELTHLAERHVGRMRRRILEGVLRDESGFLALTWFNQVAYFRSRFEKGQRCVVHGKVEGAPGGQKRIVHPEVFPASDIEGQGVVPVYGKPTTMNPAAMRTIAANALSGWSSRLPSVLPDTVTAGRGIIDLAQAMRLLHHPDREADVDALNSCRSLAHRSLVFDELFFLQLGMALRRRRVESQPGFAMANDSDLVERLRDSLPFRLTMAQQRVIHEIGRDMAQPRPMHRLVQGDVGSGKTVVAVFAAARVIGNGFQAAMMAPTELLAEQHAASLRALLEPLGIEVALLLGLRAKVRRNETLERIAAGEVPFVVGTHAVIQE